MVELKRAGSIPVIGQQTVIRLWLISLAVEAVLAVLLTRRDGFAAFRRFLWYDVATQGLGIACSGSGAWYPIVHRWSEVGAIVLLGFVVAERMRTIRNFRKVATSRVAIATNGVAERTCKQSLPVALWWSTAAGCCLHVIFAAPVPWSAWASVVWQGVALSHSIMGILLLATVDKTGHVAERCFGNILGLWLLADAALFYVAPRWPVGMAVLWLNAGTWAVLASATGMDADGEKTSDDERSKGLIR